MVEDLGEVRIKIEEEGTEEAANQIAEATGEDGLGGGQQDGGEGTVGQMLGGISGKLAAILGVLGVVASLKPIQELLSGIARLLSITLLPFVALINTFLQPVLQQLLRFIGETDLDSSINEFITKLQNLIQDVLNDIASTLSEKISGLSEETSESLVDRGAQGASFAFGFPAGLASVASGGFNVGGPNNQGGNILDNIDINLGILGEQSPSGLNENAAETTNKETSQNGLGGIF